MWVLVDMMVVCVDVGYGVHIWGYVDMSGCVWMCVDMTVVCVDVGRHDGGVCVGVLVKVYRYGVMWT